MGQRKERLLETIQNYNDDLGSKFLVGVEHRTEMYKQGRIHHEEYIKEVELCCKQAKELLIKVN